MKNHLLRMGLTMPYTSKDGAEHPNSFWVLKAAPIDIHASQIALHYIGYHSTEAYNNECEPIAGAEKSYWVAGADYMAAVFQPTNTPPETPIAQVILAMAWSIAIAQKDEPGPDSQMISFFENAVPPPPVEPVDE